MTNYVDGYILPVPKKNLTAYLRIAKAASKIWCEHGALRYRECVSEENNPGFGLSFAKGIQCKRGEVVVFAWVEYQSKAQRDRVNAKIMKDPRIAAMCDPKKLPFDPNRMLYEGFKVRVTAG